MRELSAECKLLLTTAFAVENENSLKPKKKLEFSKRKIFGLIKPIKFQNLTSKNRQTENILPN